jgi:hypothetical protein
VAATYERAEVLSTVRIVSWRTKKLIDATLGLLGLKRLGIRTKIVLFFAEDASDNMTISKLALDETCRQR